MMLPTDDERRGYVHEACLYGSDDELLEVVVPFLEGAVRSGEATLVDLGERNTELVRTALADPDAVTFVTSDERYTSPAATIRHWCELFDTALHRGGRRIRAVGEIPEPGVHEPWDPWARYEAAINRAFASFPVWGICAYDARSTQPDILRDVTCTHARIATPDGNHMPNEHFVDPVRFLTERPDRPPDPLQSTPPALELDDPWPHEARLAVEPLAAHLSPDALDDLTTAVSEVVANARIHGDPPTLVRAWVAPDRVVVSVRDRGAGPADPFAGLLPPERDLGDGGLGLWIAHQLCTDVAMTRQPDGFEIRVTVGAPVSA